MGLTDQSTRSPESERVRRWVRDEIQTLAPYRIPDAAGMVKLDAMESPYGWEAGLREQWVRVLQQVELNRYPDPQARELKLRLRRVLGVPDGMEIMLGNGSDELILILQMALKGAPHGIMAPTPSFVMYEHIARVVGRSFVGVPLARDFSLDAGRMVASIERNRPACVFLACPNNPTGNLFDREAVDRIIQATDSVVVVDEAYFSFCGETYLERLPHRDNLMVMRTLSKHGLAGLRLGILIGAPHWLEQCDKARLPYNVNALTQASAEFALAHQDVLDRRARMICAERDRLYESLRSMPLANVYPSRANFILFRTPAAQAGRIHARLLEQGVLIRALDRPGTALADCLRVTVGAPEENDRFLNALDASLAG